MDKEKEIEEMAEIVNDNIADYRMNDLYECATALVNAGYGNIKQAVKEFAERLKKELFAKCTIICADDDPIEEDMNSAVVNKTIDNLIKELFPDDTV